VQIDRTFKRAKGNYSKHPKGPMKRIVLLAVSISLLAICLLGPGSALASSSSTCQAYNPQLCVVSSGSAGSGNAGGGTLPFTGLDVALLAAGGGTLVGAGFVVRRASRRLN
jgi:hypothetical protein